MGIAFDGINTGLPPNLVDKLVEVERIPIKNIEAKKAKTQNRLDLVNDLESRVRELNGTLGEIAGIKGFSDLVVNSGDPDVVTGVADPEVVKNGSWNIEVLQLAHKSAAISNGFPDKDETELGIGYLSFETAEGTKEVFIDGDNNTLETVANKINAAEAGLQATVVQDHSNPDYPYRIMISGVGLGKDSEITYPTVYLLDGDQDFYFDKERQASNGKVKIDGFDVEVSDNKVEDLIPGLTLDLKQSAPGKEVNISITENYEVIGGKIKNFVESMNKVLSFIQSQNRLTESSDTSSTLGGDSMLRRIESNIRRLIQAPQMGINGSVKRLNDLGVVYNRNGTLDFDEEKFNSVLAQRPNDVREFFVGDRFSVGLIPSVKNLVSRTVSSSFSPIANRKRGLQTQIRQADERIERIERNLIRKEANLRRKFANLEETMSRMKSQNATLQARLGGSGGLNLNLSGASL